MAQQRDAATKRNHTNEPTLFSLADIQTLCVQSKCHAAFAILTTCLEIRLASAWEKRQHTRKTEIRLARLSPTHFFLATRTRLESSDTYEIHTKASNQPILSLPPPVCSPLPEPATVGAITIATTANASTTPHLPPHVRRRLP
jgi:hypothetical protein